MTRTGSGLGKLDYTAITDRELAALCAARDPHALRHLVTSNNQRLFHAAWSVLRNRSDAEEAVQASYARALAAIAKFEGRSALSTWLMRITINEALGRVRVQQRRRKNLEANNVTVLDHYRDRMARGSDSPSPEAEAAREQLRQLLEQAVSGLPDAFRTTFVLHEVDGLPIEEIADILGIPAGTVKTRLFRARRKLQEALAPDVRSVLSGTFPFAGADCERLTERVLAAHLGNI